MYKIAVDAMGGDNAPIEQIKGAMLAVKDCPDITIKLFGNERIIKKHLTDSTRIEIVHTDAPVVPMDCKDPVTFMRTNKKTSMALAIKAANDGECDAVVSSGATQAYIVGLALYMKRIKGVKRTAIAPIIPSYDGRGKILIDAGGNLEVKPAMVQHQVYYANMFAENVLNRRNPKVGLINIGTEDGKGREWDKEVFALFKENPKINFIGNVEPDTIMTTDADILVSDGFTANIVMKTLIGAGKGMGKVLKREMKKGIFGKLGLLLSIRNLGKYKKALSADEVGGACIYGLVAPAVKAKGNSVAYGFKQGIKLSRTMTAAGIVKKVEEQIAREKEE